MTGKRVKGKEHEAESNEKRLIYDLTYKDVVDILTVVDHSVCRELHLELGDLKLTVMKRGSPGPTIAAAQGELAPAEAFTAHMESTSADREKGESK